MLCCSIVGNQSAIEWTDATWNPVTGCTKISPGCKHCYAERLAARLQAMGNRCRPDMAPHTLQRSSRPGAAGALFDFAWRALR